ncbi:UDP-N-acetyl-D-mannosaminuronic acid dehydrogenase [Alkalithermobacter thermoalcaliphilus JW-YL-7 = DSM 7308]|uniref:Nucleotide sugar dehydrogenase n=1 Tax=Alkalithermobacter thermoalcaliphilus JW-YL-7 = DSM 7308 TaxID=1121328 RepID=A0A150FSA6_CLOPD|nr:nucleotide sugar dehydrogenase [[Clostridium] paradoxum JW-YL-7 = DSM 7308]SHK72688.1 UDP-N-acetyl-D-mannosaminuronic acid dehydrogenase [[Clostridium] paradoxum JW-YL-7 = DSM 7308]
MIKDSLKNVAVFGQGFVGLPLALSFAMRGSNVYGVDVVKVLVEEINEGITHHTEQFEGKTITQILKEQLKEKRYKATTNAKEALEVCNNIVVTVGIPIRDSKYDFSDLEECVVTIAKNLKKGDLVLIRSTVIPGTTEEKLLPILERESGLKAGEDFYLAYSSERIAEGKAFDEFAYMPTIVAGINEESTKRAKELLEVVCKTDVIVASNIKVVETSKVFENVQRDVNIAMVQEFARFTESLGIDIYEVIKIANTHKRVNLLIPGPGVGGYCIPNAYHYLAPKAEELNVDLSLLKLAREKNRNLPNVMVNMLESMLLKENKTLENAKIGILGIAMKDYSNDDRISPPIEIINILKKRGAIVSAYDSAVPTAYDFKVDNIEQALKGKDAIMILAKQESYDDLNEKYIGMIEKGTVILDTRNIFEGKEDKLKEYGIKLMKI